ncbi:MAG: response regulator [Desulfobacterales bacterium]
MKVLLVDDEVELVSTLAERLSFRGIDVDYATTADAAIQLADQNAYDIAVLDVKMPRVRGFEIKKILEKKQPGMRFLFMTGHGSEHDFRTGIAETGESFYLVKPVAIDVLIERMKEAMEKQGDAS